MNKEIFSRYQQIALDIAQCVVNGKYPVGSKIHGRSSLSSAYNVSPETIRKAVSLLQEMDVVSVSPGSGITVLSVDTAYEFINRFKSINSVGSLRNKLLSMMEQKRTIDKEFDDTINELIDFSGKLKNLSPYNPVEVIIPQGSKYAGTTIADNRFWQKTGGTIVALRKGDNLIVSPGPYALLEEGDAVVVVGNNDTLKSVEAYLNEKD